MRLTWLNNKFICKDLYAPFKIDKDSDYIGDLKNKYDIVINQAKNSGADDESLRIIADFSAKILKSLELYYKADIAESNNIILELVRDIGNNPFAVNSVINSDAFPGIKTNELQFFRSRLGSPNKALKAKDMIHLPNSMRAKSGNYRFSIPGNPSMYLANSSYGCWIEMGCPAEIDFNVSPVLLEGNQKIFNLAISLRDFRCLNEFEQERVHCWLKLYLLIKLKEIHALVLMDIRSKAKLIMENERQAREEFLRRKEKLSATQMATDRKKLKQKQARLAELDRLIQATYEDKVLQRIPEEICVNLLTKYQEEKTELLPEIAELERKLFDCQRDEADVDEFIRRIKQYIDVQEITREMCLELIECITIDECPGRYVKAPREIHIYYKLIDKNAAEQFQRSKQNNV